MAIAKDNDHDPGPPGDVEPGASEEAHKKRHGSLRRYLLRRLGTTLLLVWGVATILFVVTTVVPADPISLMLGEEAMHNPAARQAIIDRYGLDDPFHIRYLNHFGNLLQGDFGLSMRTRGPVSTDLLRSIPATLELGFLAAIMSMTLGVTLGTVAALNREKFVDQFIRVFTLTGISMPVFWTAIVAFYIFHFRLGIFPSIGRLGAGAAPPPTVTGMFTVDALLAGDWATFKDALAHLLLPAIVLAMFTLTLLARFTRSAVLEVLNEDYIRNAQAKGLTKYRVIIGHVVRAALVPIVTVTGLMFSSVLSGTVLVEAIFGFPGIGNLMYQSALFLDMPAIVGIGLAIALVYITVNFVVDMLYGIIDPRIRIGD